MAWEGKTPSEVCRQKRDLALLHDHVAKDNLVGWGCRLALGASPPRAPRSNSAQSFRPGLIPGPNVPEGSDRNVWSADRLSHPDYFSEQSRRAARPRPGRKHRADASKSFYATARQFRQA
jgi:hypothetical protein